jgi:predicted transcriptional regulator
VTTLYAILKGQVPLGYPDESKMIHKFKNIQKFTKKIKDDFIAFSVEHYKIKPILQRIKIPVLLSM